MLTSSSVAGKNIPQATVNAVTGERYVTWYDWREFLSQHFSVIPSILQYHRFHFDSKSAGVCFVKEYSSSSEVAITMCGDPSTVNISTLLKIILPAGMTLQRQIYLYEKIQQFCTSDIAAKLTCPQPVQRSHTIASELSSTSAENEPASKSKRKCSHCRQIGHTKTVKGSITCPQQL